ncbi:MULTISPECIES: prenyltransferase [Marinobacter]|uniref:Prenyltransferase n=1 Tax=Marinobacter profundi TaxID=2666256 RepID=A0A2G1UH22_9GAMM|nr:MULTISPECIES: prenyltransferase [Marinobacter]MBD3657275.1 prenyltransferase [Marinobacter sp.]PHQ13784.1 prenyltransferase [Marinobacter profundi]
MTTSVAVLRASRPNFLLLAPLCAGLGLALVWRQGVVPSLLDTLLVFAGALLAHAAVNLLNEYEDFASGLDLITRRTPFSGGSGSLPQQPEAAPPVLMATAVTLTLVGLIGLWFLWQRGWPMLVLGGAGVVLVVTYTRWITRSPLLCLLAPGIGFGPVMVLGSVIALGGRLDSTALVTALVALLLVSELLLLNQLPDTEADRQIGRRHLPITLGRRRAAGLVSLLLMAAFMVIALGVGAAVLPALCLVALIPAPVALWRIIARLPAATIDDQRLMPVLAANVAVILTCLALLLVALLLATPAG